ncbi:MAG: NYN domain-containing protein [Blastocatellia bacterium]
MAYIVDGNNVMGQTPGWHRDKVGARRRLLSQLADFSNAAKARIAVVFDGGADSDFPEGSAHKGVKVLYARRGSDADQRIVEMVESARDRAGITVVTSDRQLGFLVKSAGAKVVRSGDFRRSMERAVSTEDQPAEKGIEPGDLSAWLRYFGRSSEDDEDE